MNEFGAALQFFAGFGENWLALEDCLENLDLQMPAEAYILVVERAEEVLCDEGHGQLTALLMTLNDAAVFWSKAVEDNGPFNRGVIPFHVLLHMSAESPLAAKRFVEAAKEVGVPLGALGGT